MNKFHLPFLLFLLLPVAGLYAQQKVAVEKNLASGWMKFENGGYTSLSEGTDEIGNTVYFKVEAGNFPGSLLSVRSARSFFVFFNGKLSGEYEGSALFKLDSLASAHYTSSIFVTIHQASINPRDLKTTIITRQENAAGLADVFRPATYFRDFVIISGLFVILLFLVTTRLNPKLSADYFSIIRIFSLREADDAQSNARLTNSANVQFYVVCSLLLGFYLMIVLHHLPDEYALPLYFREHSFGSVMWQWLRLSMIVLAVFFMKILLIFSLTRLFGLRGLARVHFFNWVRLLLIVFGVASIILFVYFIQRGQSPGFFVVFLSLVAGTLTVWVFIVFLKLNSKSEHSMFHLFSYICATEIIPLLITIEVLFQ
jgi:hypothetical protein